MPRRARGRVTLLVPARNEGSGIRETLAALPATELRRRGFEVEVLVVDGRSTDETREIAREAGARVLVQVGVGKGNAVRGAIRVAESDYVAMLDADDTYPAERIPDFVEMLERGYDVVMGSRLRGRIEDGAMAGMNKLGNVGLSWLATVLYGRRCTDVCTGLWAFRRDAVAQLPLESEGFEIEAELFAEAVKGGLNVVEVPITYRPRKGETKLSKVGDGLRIGRKLIECRLRGSFRPLVPRPVPSEAPERITAPYELLV